ncbi:MAG: ATP-dependent DNA helicase RecG, partial [Bacilli bacterium]|nr:ATP-dependent DNA helicase RecG [Bacilli bacterium]
DEEIINDFLSSLPFKLTEDQLSTIHDIMKDIKSPERMNRLVLGDVGSGKTIVAVVAILANVLSGFQATFMAPTEILAKQHYESILNYFSGYNVKIALLTGSTTKKVKEKIYAQIKNKEVDLVIGTHALLSDNLEFANLGLVITDEQHRFGVNQRSLLQNKGCDGEADVLYLSATPIPRTYALTIYGDLDISQIKTKPNMRKEIITKVKSENEITDVLNAMLEELKLGHQIFVVSPLIENSEDMNLNSVNELKEKLDVAFQSKVTIEIMHGKLKQKEKDQLMFQFQQGEIKILISTTVIEVGIDIPNATMMVIFNAERFGLATLHQLRGRVGRNALQSYCYLISNTKDNARLQVMEESTDGFYISEKDFEQRGQGDLFGVKQSGDMCFKLADIRQDLRILSQANVDASKFVESGEFKDNLLYQKIVEEINFLD